MTFSPVCVSGELAEEEIEVEKPVVGAENQNILSDTVHDLISCIQCGLRRVAIFVFMYSCTRTLSL